MHIAFPKKGDLGQTSNYREIILTSIAAKIYSALLLNRIQAEMGNIIRRNQKRFRKGCSAIGQILIVRRIIGVKAKYQPHSFSLTSQRHLTLYTERRWKKKYISLQNTKRNFHSYDNPVQEHQTNVQIPRFRYKLFNILAGVL